jgi:hypothetical protein
VTAATGWDERLTVAADGKGLLGHAGVGVHLTTITALYLTLAREPQPAESSETQ